MGEFGIFVEMMF